MDLFIRQSSGVLKRLPDIVYLKRWILDHNLLRSHSMCDEIDEQGHAQPHSTNTGSPAENLWIECDSVISNHERASCVFPKVYLTL
jgi:hypothetical protein